MKKYSKGMASFVVMMMLSPVAAQAADGKVTLMVKSSTIPVR